MKYLTFVRKIDCFDLFRTLNLTEPKMQWKFQRVASRIKCIIAFLDNIIFHSIFDSTSLSNFYLAIHCSIHLNLCIFVPPCIQTIQWVCDEDSFYYIGTLDALGSLPVELLHRKLLRRALLIDISVSIYEEQRGGIRGRLHITLRSSLTKEFFLINLDWNAVENKVVNRKNWSLLTT